MRSTTFHQSAHLRDFELTHPTTACPFCRAARRIPLFRLQSHPDVELLYCLTCDAASASRMPTDDALMSYYNRYYCGRDTKVTVDSPLRVASHIYNNSFASVLSGAISILDYGGGDGGISTLIAENLIKRGVSKVIIHVVDFDYGDLSFNRDKIIICRHDNLDCLTRSSYDLVIASAVLEHIPEPREIIITLMDLIKPSGIFYARTPYIAPLIKIATKFNIGVDFTFPAHVHDLGARFWNSFLNTFEKTESYRLLKSQPSIVETSLSNNFLRSIAAHVLKAPGYFFKESYGLVGGWEVFIQRKNR